MSPSRIPRLLGRLLAILLLLFAGVLAYAPAQFKQVRHPLTTTPKDVGIPFEDVEFPSTDAGITLRGWWMPVEHPRAALVFVHGGGASKSLSGPKGLYLARDLMARGYSVMAFDLRNHGESDSAPEGRVSFGTEESHDVIGAIDAIEKRAPGTPIGAIGWSMGGNAVIYAAAQDKRIETLVADDTFAYFREILPRYLEIQAGVPGFLAPPLAWSAEHLHDVPLELGRAETVIAEVAPRPILLVRNEGDTLVPADHVDRLAAAATSEEVWRVPAPAPDDPVWAEMKGWAAHVCTYRTNPAAYVEKVGGFLDRTFPVAAPIESAPDLSTTNVVH